MADLVFARVVRPLWLFCFSLCAALLACLPGCFYGGECRQHIDCAAGTAFCRDGSCWPNQPPATPQIATPKGQEVAVGESLPLLVSATDPEAQTLRFLWDDGGCQGAFSDREKAEVAWRPPPSSTVRDCTLAAVVKDEAGGESRATVTIHVLPANRPPTVRDATQSAKKASPGQAVQLAVVAHDPEGKPLRFLWKATLGTLETPQDQVDRSGVTWRAPTTPTGACDASVQVTITDQKGESAQHTFAIGCAYLVVPLFSSRGGYSVRVKADSVGHIYVSGVFYGELKIEDVLLRQRGILDAYLAKFDPRGRLLWIKHFGDRGDLAVRGLMLDGDDRIYVAYYFQGESVEVEGSILKNSSRDTSALGDSFLARFNAKGELAWLRHVKGTETTLINGITRSPNGDLVVIGHYSAGGLPSFQEGDGSLKRLEAAPPGGSAFLLRISADGVFRSMQGYGSPGVKIDPLVISSDARGSLYVGGYAQSLGIERTLKLGGKDLILSGISRDALFFKLDDKGAVVWARRAGGSGNDIVLGVTLAPQSGALFVGHLGADARFPDDSGDNVQSIKGAGDGYVASIDAQGQYRWITLSGSPDDAGIVDRVNDVMTDGQRVFFTGGFGGTATFGDQRLTSQGDLDLLVAELDPKDGHFVWAQSFGGTGRDLGYGLHLDLLGGLYVVGVLSKRVDLAGYPIEFSAEDGGFVWRRDLP